MRKESTDAEQKLWDLLRSHQLSQFHFRRQHPIGGYVVDFICRKANLVVELDGGQHGEPQQVAHDMERTRKLNELKLRVFRFSDYEMPKNSDSVLLAILAELVKEEPPP